MSGGDDGAGDGVLTVALGSCGPAQHVVGVVAGDGRTADDGVVATGEGAGLVEEDSVDVPHPFEREAIRDEDAGTSRDRRGDGDHEWDRESDAWGQAITSTVTTATIPAAGSPSALHTIIATTAANIAR